MCHLVVIRPLWDLFLAEFSEFSESGLHFDLRGRTSEHSLSLFWGFLRFLSQSNFGSIKPFGFWGFLHKELSYFLTYFQFTNQPNEFRGFRLFCRQHFLPFFVKFRWNFWFFVKTLVFVMILSFRRSAGSCLLSFSATNRNCSISIFKKSTIVVNANFSIKKSIIT